MCFYIITIVFKLFCTVFLHGNGVSSIQLLEKTTGLPLGMAKDHLPSILRNILEAARRGNELSDALYLDHLKKATS